MLDSHRCCATGRLGTDRNSTIALVSVPMLNSLIVAIFVENED